jgi:hypothetical protein
MTRRLRTQVPRTVAMLVTLCALALLVPAAAYSQPTTALGMDCKEAPTPDMPGQGLSAFFQKTPHPLPAQEDPFARGASTTVYEQYGYSVCGGTTTTSAADRTPRAIPMRSWERRSATGC